jgi:hypothetical protein
MLWEMFELVQTLLKDSSVIGKSATKPLTLTNDMKFFVQYMVVSGRSLEMIKLCTSLYVASSDSYASHSCCILTIPKHSQAYACITIRCSIRSSEWHRISPRPAKVAYRSS